MIKILDNQSRLLACGTIEKIYFTEALKFQPRKVNKLLFDTLKAVTENFSVIQQHKPQWKINTWIPKHSNPVNYKFCHVNSVVVAAFGVKFVVLKSTYERRECAGFQRRS